MSLHIGVNARTFAVPEPGGAVQAARRFTRELSRFDDVTLTLYGAESLRDEFDATVVSTGFSDSLPLQLAWERTYLPWRAGRDGVDVLFCPNGNGPLYSPDYPVALFIHDVNAQIGLSGGLHGLYRKTTVPRAARVADMVITVSEFSKDEIVTHLGIRPGKISVVHNGIEDLFLSDDPGDEIELPDRYVLFVGAMNPRKNVTRLLEAAAGLPDDTELVMIGPDNKAAFDSLDVTVPENVRVLGYVTKRELKYAYRNADCFIFPSLYEGFGLPPLEAMACGTPVVAGDAGALPEVLGEAAEFVDPESVADIQRGVNTVLTSRNGEDGAASKGRDRAKAFSWENAGENLRGVFEDL
ncbi:glycosyltransferase family 4 protein [Haloarcula laminariae]|uniref:glycosyltransferase family 4 protein n=1 Tax=Haloarcula laminariae TaxID=2961577 RepID=UPI002406FBDF|nr:glycosyltransferase family 1 protein [Halomicroarcula sp. FL173]